MKYKFAMLEMLDTPQIKRYEFDSLQEAQEWVDQKLKEFKLVNKVRNELTDKSYLRFKQELDAILNAEG